MSRIYDNWERLVDAVLKKQQFLQLAHDQSRTPTTISSEASNLSRSPIDDVAIDFLSPASSSQPPNPFAKSHHKLVFPCPDFEEDDILWPCYELLGIGTFGSVYKVVPERTHMTFVVKKLNSGITSELDFERNMEIVGNVKHENVVALRAYSCSKHESESLMLYDHYSKGSVCVLLHGKIGEKRALIDWETRMRIAIGAARGITKIHAQNGGKFVHGNIKASNIFINSRQFGCISDVGFASMIAKTSLATTWCYAPEVKNTLNISQASDVYSFGVFLLELLTRKSPVPVLNGPQAVNLVKLITSVKSKEWDAKVFDADLLNHTEIKDQMVKLLKIGIRCVEKSPKKRPVMSVVVKKLEEISFTSFPLFPFFQNTKKKVTPATFERNLEFVQDHNTVTLALPEQKLVFVQDDNATFGLEDLWQSSSERLRRGTYKTFLKNGNTIVVKRLMPDMNVTFEEFQQHVEAIGRLRHDNIFELRAYCNSKEEKLLVYDYCNQGSLSSTPLGWPARLRIAVGAARGLAYVHRQDGGTFVHGNIKATNIFLNERQYGVVSDVGLQKFAGRVGPSCYRAPEVTNTGGISQASDVYSFGVVLLEFVTGRDCRVVYLVDWIRFVLLSGEEWASKVLDSELLQSWGAKDDEVAMVKLLRIGLDCVAPVPEQRPKMPQVVKRLREISEVYTVDMLSIESRLEHALDHMFTLVRLGFGDLGPNLVNCVD